MNEVEKKKKIFGIIREKDDARITVTHVTIRQSIFFLVLKLLFLEGVAIVGIVSFHIFLFTSLQTAQVSQTIQELNIPLFLSMVFFKTVLTIYIIIEWLEEYYEITPKEVIHKKGLLFRKEERYSLKHLERMRLEQGILGKIFNYGSLSMYNWVLGKDIQLYLIHNPLKYHSILETLLPEADEQKDIFREHLLYKERL